MREKSDYMPYVEKHDRAKLEAYITDLAEDMAKRLASSKAANREAELGAMYKAALLETADAIIARESGKDTMPRTPAQRMGTNLWEVAKRKGGSIKVDWLGNLNYCVTRLIQMVPHAMAERHGWKAEFNSTIYLVTSGALEQSALEVRTRYVPPNIEWVLDGLVGVLFDIEDEYKRRVDTAYQAVRVSEVGDVYDAPFRTKVVATKGAGGSDGFQEIMMDYSSPQGKKAPAKSPRP